MKEYKLHPLDVGFDIRMHDMAASIDAADDPIRVSYASADGRRGVIEGPQAEVLEFLRALGYRFEIRRGDA